MRLELVPNELSNNTLLMVDDIGEAEGALSCTTDRKSCCSNESSADIGSWFLPNGSKIETNYSQILYVSLGTRWWDRIV